MAALALRAYKQREGMRGGTGGFGKGQDETKAVIACDKGGQWTAGRKAWAAGVKEEKRERLPISVRKSRAGNVA